MVMVIVSGLSLPFNPEFPAFGTVGEMFYHEWLYRDEADRGQRFDRAG